MSKNKWKKRWIRIFMALMLMLSGCGADVQEGSSHEKITLEVYEQE